MYTITVVAVEADYWKPLQIGADVDVDVMVGELLWMLYRAEAFMAVVKVAV